MTTFSQKQSNIVEALIDTASTASAVLGLPLELTEAFIASVTAFLKTNGDRLGEQPFLLAFEPSNSRRAHLTVQRVIENVNTGKVILYVNQELRFIRSSGGSARLTDSCALTKQENILAVLVSGTYTYDLLQGTPISEGYIGVGRDALPVISQFHRPMDEFEGILIDHLNESLNGGQIKLWFDKSKRILLSEPEGTELMFHRSLFWWLKFFVSPKLKVYAEPRGLGQDRTDITVVTTGGSYVIEVKWLGVNSNGHEYKQGRIDEGLAQVKIYLDNDRFLVCGHLVCYDGRSIETHETETFWNDSLRHELCKDPQVLFLSSEAPSVAAVAIARRATR